MNDFVLNQHSRDAKDFLKLMLMKSESKRPTASQALSHKWFSCLKPGITQALTANQPTRGLDSLPPYYETLK